MKDNVINFEITKRYVKVEDVKLEDSIYEKGAYIPVFDSIATDKYGNTIGRTRSGDIVLIESYPLK